MDESTRANGDLNDTRRSDRQTDLKNRYGEASVGGMSEPSRAKLKAELTEIIDGLSSSRVDQPTMSKKVEICYLCGNEIDRTDRTKDHVPPKQFYPKVFRDGLNLRWLRAHRFCNETFGEDEEYFKHSIGASQRGTPALDGLWMDLSRTLAHEESGGLGRKVYREFSTVTPSGVCMPAGVVVKTYDARRVDRIIWKIVRGLHFLEYGEVLPAETKHAVFRFSQDHPEEEFPRQLLDHVKSEPMLGAPESAGVFSYRKKPVVDVSFPDDAPLVWGLLFWDKFIFLATHEAAHLRPSARR